ncbi:glycosyltransferase family A protein [Streptomyces sp. YIM 130001]|uniref:glycosyltransferase family A protein n=1 Tax=Streptomyces sp. YIM 130001 TaxID=2259644 RepID=UPI000E64985D|nr:glycosyltransferase family A protein [Streptomyces sp. YIM 130001]
MSIVVIGYNDAPHVVDAVRSALAQGPHVREVIAVDDHSTDASPRLLAALAADDSRVRPVLRRANSGGCGTPRNDGIDAATSAHLMFLDSDDVLPPGAVDALLTAAREHGTEVTTGRCLRRELPSGHETVWQPGLYDSAAIIEHPAHRTSLVQDTLCVNKLYRTDFLRQHRIRFPEGRFLYEDFVFTARVLAAAPRIALIANPVYVWHVRREAARLSLSLDRAGIGNWTARLDAHRQAVEILAAAGEQRLASAARAKFLDHSLCMYARELGDRSAEYRAAWWHTTRAYLSTFDAADFARAPAPGRVIARVVLAAPDPVDLPRIKEIAARPARLLPPYAVDAAGAPIWSQALPQVPLDHLLVRPMRLLPLAVDAEVRPRARASTLTLRLHDLYGRASAAVPVSVDVELLARADRRTGLHHTAPWTPDGPADADSAAPSWSARVDLDLAGLDTGLWDLRLRVRFADGSYRDTTAHPAPGPGRLHPRFVLRARRGLLLLRPYSTRAGSLAVRVAPGASAARSAARARLRRLLDAERSRRKPPAPDHPTAAPAEPARGAAR